MTESAVTADAACPPLGMGPLRRRWHLARTFSAAGLVEWLGDGMARLWAPLPGPPPSLLSALVSLVEV